MKILLLSFAFLFVINVYAHSNVFLFFASNQEFKDRYIIKIGNETNPSIMNGMITYTYDNAGRRTGMSLSNGIDSFAQANYTYDTRGRIATVGNNTDTLTYTYVPGTNMIGSATWQNASINTVNTYDQYKRLTNIAVNGASVYGYTLNDKNQRTSATLPDGNKWNYTYDVMGQLTGAVKQDTANNPLANMNYFYDLIGNRTSATENSATTTYASNLVNQYTAINAVVPVYDLDGNMTNYNGWNYTYNGENRLIVAENAATGVRVEADYDYMGRRIFKKVYNNNTLMKHSLFVYDGFKQIAEFDALNNNTLKASYLWQPVGLDVVLLRNNEYLVADGNKNIIQVCNATGSVTDSYVYDPFGKVTHNGTSENPFQFSSEFFDDETELVYYNYRYYNPNLGRWINRDPIEEEGGWNLYVMVGNNTSNHWDFLGNRSYGERQRRQAGQNYVNQGRWRNPSPLNLPFGSTGSGGLFELLDMAISYRIKRDNISKINQARSACRKKCKLGLCDYCCGIFFRYTRVRYNLASIMSFSVTFYKGKCNNSYIYAYEPGISTTIENIPMKCQN